jgi:hypothetical protein
MATVPTANGPRSAIELAARFWDSDTGKFMDEVQPLRFSHAYYYDPAHACEDLGPNLRHKGHAEVTTAHVINILEGERRLRGKFPFPPERIGTLVFTALIHDSGETMEPKTEAITDKVVGDVESGKKTDEARRVEMLVRAANYMRYYPDLSVIRLRAIEGLITHRDKSAWHRVLEAGHAMAEHGVTLRARAVADRETIAAANAGGWLSTLGVRLPEGYVIGKPTRTEEEIRTLQHLAHRVGTNILDHVIREMTDEFIHVREYAEQQGLLLAA